MRWRSKQNRLNAHRRARYLPLSIFDRFKSWIVLACVFALLGAATWRVWRGMRTEHWFLVSQVLIEGELHRINPDHLAALLGLAKRPSLFFLDLETLRQRLEGHPWVKEVRLERRLPHTLLVQVLEHEPIAIASMPEYYYVNAEEQLFKRVEKGESMDFPLFALPAKQGSASPGDIDRKMLHETIDFLEKYDQTRFSKEFGASEILWRENGFSVFTKKGELQIEVAAVGVKQQLWKLDRYYPNIIVEHNKLKMLDLQLTGKIIASAK